MNDVFHTTVIRMNTVRLILLIFWFDILDVIQIANKIGISNELEKFKYEARKQLCIIEYWFNDRKRSIALQINDFRGIFLRK